MPSLNLSIKKETEYILSVKYPMVVGFQSTIFTFGREMERRGGEMTPEQYIFKTLSFFFPVNIFLS